MKIPEHDVLIEVLDANDDGRVDRGWGTVIVDPHALRELSHQAPHPIADSTTENQAVGVFKGSQSRSFIMAGAHRNANSTVSSCQGDCRVSDAAHNADTMLQATTQELLAFYGAGAWNLIQWHGMSAEACPDVDVYLSHGRDQTPANADQIVALQDQLRARHPTWRVEVPGSGVCDLNASDNVQGRLLNGIGSESVCGTAVSSYSGIFVHIEQAPGFRQARDWISAINESWPALPQVPAAPGDLKVTGATRTRIRLAWTDRATDESGFQIERSSDGQPFRQIAGAEADVQAFTDSGLQRNKRFYYRVRAFNAAGPSAYSNIVTAKTPWW